MTMFSEQRRSEILDMLAEKGSLTLVELTKKFSVSEATIRRDLTELESLGKLQRTHGGAVRRDLSLFENNYAYNELVNIESKREIARICEKLVHDGDTVMLDSGTTTYEIARVLKNKKITLITNSATIIADFVENGAGNITFISTGGVVRPNFRSFVGSFAEDCIRSVVPDISFVCSNGFSLQRGASTPDISEASLKRIMLQSSKKSYLVSDSSKEGKDFFCVISDLRSFDGIIIDKGISPESVKKMKSHGINVITE